jgi:hypothetical protein
VEPIDDLADDLGSVQLEEAPSEFGDQVIEVGVETEMVPASVEQSSEVFKPADMDKILEEAFLTAVKLKLPEDAKQYPIGSSALYDSYVAPCRMIGTNLDVKNSTYKKVRQDYYCII